MVNSLYVTIDAKLKGAVSVPEFKAIMVLISEIGHNDKLFMICGLLEPTEFNDFNSGTTKSRLKQDTVC